MGSMKKVLQKQKPEEFDSKQTEEDLTGVFIGLLFGLGLLLFLVSLVLALKYFFNVSSSGGLYPV